ncbi:MAG: hypothetical protein ACI83D_000712 [Planctomycetota bacterium]|jgi:hypothetical protein
MNYTWGDSGEAWNAEFRYKGAVRSVAGCGEARSASLADLVHSAYYTQIGVSYFFW